MTEVMRPERQSLYSRSPLKRSAASSTSLSLAGTNGYQYTRPQYSSRKQEEEDYEPASPSSSSSSSSSSGSSSQLDLHASHDINAAAIAQDPSSFEDLNAELPSESSEDETEDETDDADSPPPPSPQEDDELITPTSSPVGETASTSTPEAALLSTDDTAIQHQPSRHVDYLSHSWKEEEIWSSWRHIVSKRWYYGERSRLENASWRTWAKQKNHLKTVSPDTLNWLKDCDVTWLYGPLQTPSRYSVSEPNSEPPSQLSKSNSFVQKKPILKKRSASEVMLQKSISASSLVKQAAAAVQAQQKLSAGRHGSRPSMGRAISDFVTAPRSSMPPSRGTWGSVSSSHETSGLVTPDEGNKRHIRFDDQVTQCIAIESDEGEEERGSWSAIKDDSDDSDDGGLTMKQSKTPRKPLSRTNSRSSFSSDTVTIAKLPPTSLKDRDELPDIPEIPTHSLGVGSFWPGRPRLISPSPSQETLRPCNPSRNFLLEDDDSDDEIGITPGSPHTSGSGHMNGKPIRRSRSSSDSLSNRGKQASTSNLRRTASGMFMPYEEEEDSMMTGGILGKMVETVNTAKDIAHVIWNVGWRK